MDWILAKRGIEKGISKQDAKVSDLQTEIFKAVLRLQREQLRRHPGYTEGVTLVGDDLNSPATMIEYQR